MDVPPVVGLPAVLALVLVNGFFVATEFAIVAVRRSRLEQLAATGDGAARAAQRLVARLDTYIAACQLGITMASLALGWIGEPALSHLIEPPLEALAGRFAHTAAESIAVAGSFAVITALHIVAGELAPKGLALQRPEGTALFVARPMLVFELLFRWPIALLNGVGNGVLRLLGMQPAAGHELVHSVEELRLLVTGSQQAGVVDESEARIASRAFAFGERTAGALMTPRTAIEALPLDLPPAELRARVAGSSHGRLPVYDGSLDNIAGALYVADYYRALDRRAAARDGGGPPGVAQLTLRPLLRQVMRVPESKPAGDLLEEMRAAGRYFAVVLDEYGGTAGLVTVDDLFEALVGTLPPERADAAPPPTPAAAAPDGSLLVDGLLRLDEWEEATGLEPDPAEGESVTTIGGLVMARLGRIPETGDEVQIAGRLVRVEQMDGHRVARVRLLPEGLTGL